MGKQIPTPPNISLEKAATMDREEKLQEMRRNVFKEDLLGRALVDTKGGTANVVLGEDWLPPDLGGVRSPPTPKPDTVQHPTVVEHPHIVQHPTVVEHPHIVPQHATGAETGIIVGDNYQRRQMYDSESSRRPLVCKNPRYYDFEDAFDSEEDVEYIKDDYKPWIRKMQHPGRQALYRCRGGRRLQKMFSERHRNPFTDDKEKLSAICSLDNFRSPINRSHVVQNLRGQKPREYHEPGGLDLQRDGWHTSGRRGRGAHQRMPMSCYPWNLDDGPGIDDVGSNAFVGITNEENIEMDKMFGEGGSENSRRPSGSANDTPMSELPFDDSGTDDSLTLGDLMNTPQFQQDHKLANDIEYWLQRSGRFQPRSPFDFDSPSKANPAGLPSRASNEAN
eukprot:Selendium_serpulae@DN2551_c0_g1_i1.p1